MSKPRKKPVLHDCDANSDDLITSMVMRNAPNLELVASVITNGLCYVADGYRAMRRLEHFTGCPEVEIGVCDQEMPNPFPPEWRSDSRRYNRLPCLARALGKVRRPRRATAVVERRLKSATAPITFVCTGPTTVLAAVLKRKPELAAKIRQLVVMGGAVRVAGNVQAVHAGDGTAEWNVFCDPHSFKTVLAHDIPVRLIALDVTNQLPIDRALLDQLKAMAATSRCAEVAAQMWELQAGRQIYLWDPTTALSLIRPDLFRFEYVGIDVVTEGRSAGRLVELPPGQGRLVELATAVDKEQVLACFLQLLGNR